MSNITGRGIFPPVFVLKVHNGKYLRRMGQDVQAHDEHKGAEYGFWEPFYKQPFDVAIRATSGHNFWRYNRDWIKIDADHLDEKNRDIWFRAVQVSPTEVGIFCPSNGTYLYPLTADGRTDTLNAASAYLHQNIPTVFEVEPAYLHRRIENVIYDFDNKEEEYGKPIAAGEVQVWHHGSKVALTINRTVSFTVAKERSWNTTSTFKENVEMSVETPVYGGVEAGFSVSNTKTKVDATGYSNGEVVKDETAVSITAKPHHKTTAHFILSRGHITAPFKYDETIQHFNGKSEKNHKTDGVFHAKDAGVFASWNIEVEEIKEQTVLGAVFQALENTAEAGTKVAEAGVSTATTATTTGLKTVGQVGKTTSAAAGSVLGGISKGVGGIFHS